MFESVAVVDNIEVVAADYATMDVAVGKVIASDYPMDDNYGDMNGESTGLSTQVILYIVIGVCAVVGIVLGIIMGKRAANK